MKIKIIYFLQLYEFVFLINFKGKKLGHRFLQMSISDKTVIILLIIVELFLVTLVTHWLISCFSDYQGDGEP